MYYILDVHYSFCTRKRTATVHFNLKHPKYINERNFDGLLFTLDKIFLENHFLEINSPVHCASFGTF